jgi:hypothetical protein
VLLFFTVYCVLCRSWPPQSHSIGCFQRHGLSSAVANLSRDPALSEITVRVDSFSLALSAAKGPDGKDLSFMFKCHRVDKDVFPVNAVSFHPNPDAVTQNVLVTAGSDGTFCFWDKKLKHKISEYSKLITGMCVVMLVFFYAPPPWPMAL